jgi:tetratricopeptide (TPR) repeat protein
MPERQARIAELQDRYDHLALDDSDKQRLLKDKIGILSLLGKEHAAAFEYLEAEKAFMMAIALQERLRVKDNDRGGVWFELGNLYFTQERLLDARTAYEQCKTLGSKINTGVIYHQLGKVYHKEQHWEAALENFQQSLNWAKSTADEFDIGRAYHSIGMLYGDQQQWVLALDNYRQALKWAQRAGINVGLGLTYLQIGAVYQRQAKWSLALKNYHLALDWQKRTGNHVELGGCYFQIGRVYLDQQRYAAARPWFEKAVENFTKYGHPFLPHAEAALARTLAALQQAKKTPSPKPKRRKKR